MSGKYSEGKYERTFTQQEVDAQVAAALEKAAEHEPKVSFCTSPGFGSTIVVECAKCGQQLTGWHAHILATADQNALAEHDAALRQAHNADLIAASLDFDEERADLKAEIVGLRESYRKLEAENAELRLHLAIGLTAVHREVYDDATRALLAKSGGGGV